MCVPVNCHSKRAALRPPGEPKRHKPKAPARAPAVPRALTELEGQVAAAQAEPGDAAAEAGTEAQATAPRAPQVFTVDQLRKSKARALPPVCVLAS